MHVTGQKTAEIMCEYHVIVNVSKLNKLEARNRLILVLRNQLNAELYGVFIKHQVVQLETR